MKGKLRTLGLTLIAFGLLSGALAQSAPPPIQPTPSGVVDGFNGPQGVTVGPDGSAYVIEAGLGGPNEVEVRTPEGVVAKARMGDTARVVRIFPSGRQKVVASLPSIQTEMEAVGGGRLAFLRGRLYATSGDWAQLTGPTRMPNMGAVLWLSPEGLSEVANTFDLELAQNPDPGEVYTHPYGLAAGPDGRLWVADAGGNTLLRVNRSSGEVELVTAFAPVPAPQANPGRGGRSEADAVPTGIAFDAEGNAYVSLLPGTFYIPGSSRVVKIDTEGTLTNFAGGLTATTDLKMGPDGVLYATSLGLLGEQGPVPGSGSVVRLRPGAAPETVVSGLTLASSLAFNRDGDLFVTVGALGAPGSGQLLRFDGIAR